MFYVVVCILLGYLEVVTSVHIVTENNTIYFDSNTDSNILLRCNFTEKGSIEKVEWQNSGDKVFESSIVYFTASCYETVNKAGATVTCNDSSKEYSASIPIQNINDGEKWRCGGVVSASNIGFSKPVQILSVVSVDTVVILNYIPLVSIDEGDNISLECQSEPACRPQAELKWLKTSGAEILQGHDDPRYTEDKVDSTLTVANLRVTYIGNSSDNGNSLFCTANQWSETVPSLSVRLNVRYPPSSQLVLSVSPNGTIADNTTVNATCLMHGGNPLATLVLSCNGNFAMNYDTTLTSISILIFTATSSYNGKRCVCTASHPVNDYYVNKSEIIDVKYAPSSKPTITQFPINPVIENTVISLTCAVSGGNPLASLSWDCWSEPTNTISNNTVTSNVSLLVSRLDNGKVCTCTATHSVTGYNPKVEHRIIVYYAPDLPLIITQDPVDMIDTGETMNLTCEVIGGNPLANLSWDCGSAYINNTSGNKSSISVRVKVDKTFNNKVCTCSAAHPVSSFRPIKQQVLIVNYPPSTPSLVINPEPPFFEGNGTDIECSVNDTGNPQSAFTWVWNMTVVPPHNSSSFRIEHLKRSDNGAIIACRVHNEYSNRKGINIQVNNSLNVEYYPIVILKNKTVKIIEGGNLSIQCIVLGNPTPKAHWLKEGQQYSFLNGGETINLTIPVVYRNDTGRYQCKGVSDSKQYGTLRNSKYMELIVNYPPDVTIYSILNQEHEDYITYVCNATGNPASYKYMGWEQTYNGKIIRTSKQLELLMGDNNKNLTLKQISLEDSGNYTCFVHNGVRGMDGRLQQFGKEELNVTVSPQLLLKLPTDDTYSTEKGGTITVDLKYVTFPDITEASWYNLTSNSTIEKKSNNDVSFTFEQKTIETSFHGIKVNVSNYAYQAIFKMKNFVSYMEGSYILRLRNGFKDKDITIKAVISSKPEDPSDLNVTSRTSTAINISWKRGYNGGHSQFFNISVIDSTGKRSNKQIDDNYNETQLYTIEELTPSTVYVIHLYAFNKINSSNVLTINSTTANTEVFKTAEQQFPVGAVAGGVVGLLIAVLVVMIIYIKRRWSTSREGKKKRKTDRRKLTSTFGDESDGDGLKINDLYVSAGDDFNEKTKQGDVYAVVKKANERKNDAKKDIQETGLYAEVNKKRDSPNKDKSNAKQKIKTKIQKTKNDDVYENISEGNNRTILPLNKNKDGLVYADLVFNDDRCDGRKKFVIRGLENKTDYADIDLNIKVDPLPSDESDQENEYTTNEPNGVQETK